LFKREQLNCSSTCLYCENKVLHFKINFYTKHSASQRLFSLASRVLAEGGEPLSNDGHDQHIILKWLLTHLLPPLVLHPGKREVPGTSLSLPTHTQTPKRRSDTYDLLMFRLLALHRVGKKPYCKPEPMDLHRCHSGENDDASSCLPH